MIDKWSTIDLLKPGDAYMQQFRESHMVCETNWHNNKTALKNTIFYLFSYWKGWQPVSVMLVWKTNGPQQIFS